MAGWGVKNRIKLLRVLSSTGFFVRFSSHSSVPSFPIVELSHIPCRVSPSRSIERKTIYLSQAKPVNGWVRPRWQPGFRACLVWSERSGALEPEEHCSLVFRRLCTPVLLRRRRLHKIWIFLVRLFSVEQFSLYESESSSALEIWKLKCASSWGECWHNGGGRQSNLFPIWLLQLASNSARQLARLCSTLLLAFRNSL